jgi:AcrR family transcriptional regulator
MGFERNMNRVVGSQVQSKKLVSDRRDRIIRAAITVFHRRGYHLTTTADIAREAGLTQSNLYNYVKSKHDVLFLVCDHLMSTYSKVIDEVCDRVEDPHTRLVEALRAITAVMSTYHHEVQLLYNETHALEKADRAIVLNAISQFIGRFEQLLDDFLQSTGRKLPVDARIAANFLSFVPAVTALRYWDLVLHQSEKCEDEIVGFILRGLDIPPLPAETA